MTAPTPGVFSDFPEPEYHAHWALSQSLAKHILAPGCPALVKHLRENGEKPKAVWEFGSAAHKRVLGVGQEVRYLPFENLRTKKAQEEVAAARSAGAIPLLEEQRGVIEGMEQAIRDHPLASALLNPEFGKPEQSLFAQDPETGTWLRSRLDWLRNPSESRLLLVDYKTTKCAHPAVFVKDVVNLGYHFQCTFYRRMAILLGLDPNPAYLFVAQEKTPPYLVSVSQLPDELIEKGDQLNRQAIDLYADCLERDSWPGYDENVTVLETPGWYRYQLEQEDSA
jgi:hypothetical protein